MGGIAGSFGESSGSGTIQNCRVEDSLIEGVSYCGGIVGSTGYDGDIISCYTSGKVIATSTKAGGIVGEACSGDICNNISCMDVSVKSYGSDTRIGGILADSYVLLSEYDSGRLNVSDNIFMGTIRREAPCTLAGLISSHGVSGEYNFSAKRSSSIYEIELYGPDEGKNSRRFTDINEDFVEGPLTIGDNYCNNLLTALSTRMSIVNEGPSGLTYLPVKVNADGNLIFDDNTFLELNSEEERQTVDIQKNDVEFRGSAKWSDSLNAFYID